jgi:hypothetical protein
MARTYQILRRKREADAAHEAFKTEMLAFENQARLFTNYTNKMDPSKYAGEGFLMKLTLAEFRLEIHRERWHGRSTAPSSPRSKLVWQECEKAMEV